MPYLFRLKIRINDDYHHHGHHRGVRRHDDRHGGHRDDLDGTYHHAPCLVRQYNHLRL